MRMSVSRPRTFKMCKSRGVVNFPNTTPDFTLCDQQPIKDCTHPDNDKNDYCSYCDDASTGTPKICVANGGNPCRDSMSVSGHVGPAMQWHANWRAVPWMQMVEPGDPSLPHPSCTDACTLL